MILNSESLEMLAEFLHRWLHNNVFQLFHSLPSLLIVFHESQDVKILVHMGFKMICSLQIIKYITSIYISMIDLQLLKLWSLLSTKFPSNQALLLRMYLTHKRVRARDRIHVVREVATCPCDYTYMHLVSSENLYNYRAIRSWAVDFCPSKENWPWKFEWRRPWQHKGSSSHLWSVK